MVRSGASRATDAAILASSAALAGTVLAIVRALPAVDLAESGVAWVITGMLGILTLAATLVALASGVQGLRRGLTGALLGMGGAAAVAGGALSTMLVQRTDPLLSALPAVAGMSLAALVASWGAPTVAGRGPRILVAAGGLVVAEAAVLVGAMGGAESISTARPVLLPITAAVFGAAAMAAIWLGRPWAGAAAVAAGLGGIALLLDRGGGLELLIGLSALTLACGAGARALDGRSPAESLRSDARRLPSLAEHVTDAVLLFDGRLALRDWNTRAGRLLGLDAGSIGARLEDLLGVSIAELPGGDEPTVAEPAVGGLQVRLHRWDDHLVAFIGARVERPDEDRLGRELRGTIEELLQARRTLELQRGELERSATIDPLTGVASRAAILDRLRLEIAQARRYRHPVAVVVLDVDGFGELNRRHGIGAGDALLRELALRMRLRVREADALGRAGSDGFLAILPHTDEGGAATFAAALRNRVGQRPLPMGDELVEVTVSIGVAVMRPGEELDLDGLLARAAEALDSARSAGGDRIALDRLHGLARLEEHREPEADVGT